MNFVFFSIKPIEKSGKKKWVIELSVKNNVFVFDRAEGMATGNRSNVLHNYDAYGS